MLIPTKVLSAPKCSDKFPLDKGITRQTMEKYENEYEADFEKRKEEITADIKKTEEKRVRKLFDDKELALKESLPLTRKRAKRRNNPLKKRLMMHRKSLRTSSSSREKLFNKIWSKKQLPLQSYEGKN